MHTLEKVQHALEVILGSSADVLNPSDDVTLVYNNIAAEIVPQEPKDLKIKDNGGPSPLRRA